MIADLQQGRRAAWRYTARAPGGRRRTQRRDKAQIGQHITDTGRRPTTWHAAWTETKIRDYAGNARAVAAMAATMAGICQWTGHGDASEWAIRAALNITTAQYAIRVTTNTVRVTNRLLTKIHNAAAQGWAMTQHTRGGIDRAIANARWIATRTYMYTIAATVTIIQYNDDTEEEGVSIDIVTQAIRHMTRRSATATRGTDALDQPLHNTRRDTTKQMADATRQQRHGTRHGATRKLARTARITFLIAASIVAWTANTVCDHAPTTSREDNTATDAGSMMNAHTKTAMEACEAKVAKLYQHAHNTLTEIGRRTESANRARYLADQGSRKKLHPPACKWLYPFNRPLVTPLITRVEPDPAVFSSNFRVSPPAARPRVRS